MLYIKKIIIKIINSLGYSLIKNIEPHQRIKKVKIDTILDIGANEGQFLGEWLEIFPDAHFHSFEPLPDVFKKLEKSFGGRSNVTLHNIGLGNTNATMQMYESEFSPSSSLLKMNDIHKSAYPFSSKQVMKDISLTKLDDLKIKSKSLLVKIDTQGYEGEVIAGGKKTIAVADVCIIECCLYPLYQDQAIFSDIYGIMNNMGFIYIGPVEIGRDPRNNKPLFEDAIFVKKHIFDMLNA